MNKKCIPNFQNYLYPKHSSQSIVISQNSKNVEIIIFLHKVTNLHNNEKTETLPFKYLFKCFKKRNLSWNSQNLSRYFEFLFFPGASVGRAFFRATLASLSTLVLWQCPHSSLTLPHAPHRGICSGAAHTGQWGAQWASRGGP